MRLSAYGISLELPRGWDGRIYRRPGASPTLHAANFGLPAEDGDFGSGATAHMPDGGVFLALKEYAAGPRLRPGVGLYASRSLPLPLSSRYFHPRALQVGRPGQAGFQHFFTAAGRRAFCLYAVIETARAPLEFTPFGEPAGGANQVGSLSGVLSSLRIQGAP
jgi:hypothetical protein